MKKYLFFSLAALMGIKFSHAATFTSLFSGSYSAPANWSIVGVDADGIPDSDDNVIISGGNTIALVATSFAKTLTINPTGVFNMNGQRFGVFGNLTNNGSSIGSGLWYFRAVGTYSGNPINNDGAIFFYTNYTIAAGVTINKTGDIKVWNSGITVTNNGSITMGAGIFSIASSSRWINAAGSSMSTQYNIINNGTLDCSAATNTFSYLSNSYNTILGTNATYYNLVISTTSVATKSLNDNLTVLNNLTISSLVTLNWANKNINLGGNWTNTANTNCTNRGTITFNGAGTQTITRASTETFKDVTLTGTGTVLLAGDVTCTGNVTITTGTLDVSASNFNLNIAGNFTNTAGTLNARTGTVTFNGAAAQTISGAAVTTFYNLTSTNTLGGIGVTGAIIISNTLTVSSNSFGTSGGTIIIPATAATTYGRIAPLGVGASLTGAGWVLQGYIDGPATGGWQYMGSSTSASTLVDWDGDPGFWMSGTGGDNGNTSPMFYSVRTVNPATNIVYSNVTTQATALTPGKGFMVWMADDHGSPAMLTAPRSFDTRGTANYGTINRAVSATGYNLVSNPYACPIDYATVVASSSATLNASCVIVNGDGSYSYNPNGGMLAPTQGFLVYCTAAGNTTFTEAGKSIASSPNIVRLANQENVLKIKSSNEINGLGGEAVVRIIPEAHNGLDDADLPFLTSAYDDATNIWTTDNDNVDLFLNSLDGNSENLDIPLAVVSGAPGKQLLSFKGLNGFSDYSCASLENLATGEIVNLKIHDTYSFPAISAGERHDFVIHFERNGNCPLTEQNVTASLDASTQVYTSDGNILVQFGFEEMTDVTVTVFNTIGQEVSTSKNVSVAKETIVLDNPGAHGIFLVRITKGNEVVTKKIFL